MAEVVETSQALEYEERGRWFLGQEEAGRDGRFLSHVFFFCFLKFADMKKKDLGWTCAASWKRAWSGPSNCEVLPNTHSN